ncbi:MAG: amidohydrolase family protein, partial [Burkholderiaceae bacterium]
LRGGYTHVCEFHYLHHDRDGRPYDDPLRMGWALADAAADAGIGLTLLPVLYERAGFTQPALRDDQRRFATDVRFVCNAAQRITDARQRLLGAGLAIHSLRAAAPTSIASLREASADWDCPIHVHVAEQTGEVDDCLAATGARPIEWLARERFLDRRWQLVHATHSRRTEIDAVAATSAGVVICPSTEGNLGDGLADLPGWLAAGVPIAIGSDSHVTRDALEELRWMEYGQRLSLNQRNIGAAPGDGQPSTAARWFDVAVASGAAAAGEPCWGLVEGARADGLVADPRADALLGVPADRLLDALVFSSPTRPWRDVLVAGSWAVRDYRIGAEARIVSAFVAAMHDLWRDS